MKANANDLVGDIWKFLGSRKNPASSLAFSGVGELDSAYAVTDFASAAVGAAALAIADLVGRVSARPPSLMVDRRLCSLWFGWSLRPMGWRLPAAWDPIAGDYRTSDGWIRLHTNAPRHRKAAERVMGPHADRTAMAQAVAVWSKRELETAIVEAGGCAAEMRSVAEWGAHPQGAAVAAEPLVDVETTDRSLPLSWVPTPSRPLAGLRVLDLTRVLAGPVATRFLAGYGADVLRIDPPGWEEPGVIPEVTLGKRCARLDLHDDADREQFEILLSQSDILIHGYRPGALDDLGYGAAQRRAFSPGLIDVSLSAYGWSGPWAGRRGFDSLVQMSTGIADTGMHSRAAEKPVPLPVQALDQATGYLMAAAAVRAVERRLDDGRGTEARLSLARTAKFLIDTVNLGPGVPVEPESSEDLASAVEMTDWGKAHRLKCPVTIAGSDMQWDRAAGALGSAAPAWEPRP